MLAHVPDDQTPCSIAPESIVVWKQSWTFQVHLQSTHWHREDGMVSYCLGGALQVIWDILTIIRAVESRNEP